MAQNLKGNTRDKHFTRARMIAAHGADSKRVSRYFEKLESADREESAIADFFATRLEDKIVAPNKETQRLENLEVQILNTVY